VVHGAGSLHDCGRRLRGARRGEQRVPVAEHPGRVREHAAPEADGALAVLPEEGRR
jgi:hypothetical protein